jgi:putative endonuclease
MPVRTDPATWTDRRHRVGLDGETRAMAFLRANGWSILAHRFRMGRLEIDLVARRGSVVAFIEVKTRRGGRFGSPFEAVGWKKRRDIARVAQAWIDRHGAGACTYRFDVIAVTSTSRGRTVQHVEDAFRIRS